MHNRGGCGPRPAMGPQPALAILAQSRPIGQRARGEPSAFSDDKMVRWAGGRGRGRLGPFPPEATV